MVKFYLISNENGIAKYEYYPEGDKEKTSGLIYLDTNNGKVVLIKEAEGDFASIVTAKSLNDMRDDINRMRIENGEDPLTEDELPTATEDEAYHFYASHAKSRISDLFEKGTVPEYGMVAWY